MWLKDELKIELKETYLVWITNRINT
jgi:hypothetical protein